MIGGIIHDPPDNAARPARGARSPTGTAFGQPHDRKCKRVTTDLCSSASGLRRSAKIANAKVPTNRGGPMGTLTCFAAGQFRSPRPRTQRTLPEAATNAGNPISRLLCHPEGIISREALS